MAKAAGKTMTEKKAPAKKAPAEKKAPAKKAPAKKAPAEKKERKPGIGALAVELIRSGKTNEQVLEAIQKKFPDSKATIQSVGWYRNKLRSDGEKVPTARELKAA